MHFPRFYNGDLRGNVRVVWHVFACGGMQIILDFVKFCARMGDGRTKPVLLLVSVRRTAGLRLRTTLLAVLDHQWIDLQVVWYRRHGAFAVFG